MPSSYVAGSGTKPGAREALTPKSIDRVGCVTISAKQAEWLLEGIDIWNLKPHAELEYSRVC